MAYTQSTATLSLARRNLAAASDGTRILFAGGSASGYSSQVDIYDVEVTFKWGFDDSKN